MTQYSPFSADDLALDKILNWTRERIIQGPDPRNGAKSQAALEAALGDAITSDGITATRAFDLFTDGIIPSIRPFNHPTSLAFVAAAPTPASLAFDAALGAAEIFAGNWDGGSGAIYAENQALSWLASLAGWPKSAGGAFVSGGTLGNLSALHAARVAWTKERPKRWRILCSSEAHSSIYSVAQVMDAELILVDTDASGAWEYQLSDQTMLGYFIGAEVNETDIQTELTGTQSGIGFKTGAYFVTEVYKDIFLDGFVSAGLGQSDLDMADDTLTLDGSYRPRSLAIGVALTGVFDRGSYEFWPELAATFAHTTIGDADFTGQAYGVVDNTLLLDAGDVTIATMTARPEVRISLIEEEATARLEQFTFAPRFVCERIVTDSVDESCGGGADIGFISRSQDGLTNLTWRLSRDFVGNSTCTGLEIKIQYSF